MNDKWDLRFIGLAKHVSSWSKDQSTRVGAVIFDRDSRVISVGYNGFPRGVGDEPSRYADRELKYKMVVHAEMNAIIFAGCDLKGCSIATYPFMSCSACAASIIQSGILRCVAPTLTEDLAARWQSSCDVATTMFRESGVELKLVDHVSIP